MRPELLSPALERLKVDRNDADAWEDLYRTIWPWLLWNAQRDLRTLNVADAEDLSQEVFMTLIDRTDFDRVFDHPAIFLGYTKTVCRRKAIDRLRGHKIADALVEDIPAPPSIDPILQLGLDEALEKLTPKEAKVMKLLQLGLSPPEMAYHLKSTPTTAANTVSRLRGLLRRLTGRDRQ